ncbi:MAG: metal-sensitive transcriptional regulator [Ilumatobacteraceae bacterium]
MHGSPGYHHDKQQVLTRLRRIEGQVRGLQRMIDDDTYCIDVLTQLAAVTKALQGVGVHLLDEHLQHCVAGAASGGADTTELVHEATRAVERLLRT